MRPMKKFVKRALALVLALAMLFSLSGCALTLNDMLIVKRAYKRVTQMDSMCFNGSADMSITVGKVPMQLSAYVDGQCIVDPTTVRLDVDIDLGLYGELSIPMYIYSDDKNLIIDMGLDNSSGTTWASNSFPLRNVDSEISVDSVLNNLQRDPEALVVGENEMLNDLECRPFTLKIPGETLEQALALEVPEDCDAAIDDTILTVWISVTDGMPLRLNADLASALQYIIDVTDPEYLPNLKVKTLPVTVDITSFNSIKSIEVPES